MAPSPFSLILRHLSKNPKPHNYINHFLSPVVKQLSLSSPLQSDRIPNIADSPKPSSLSARLGFIFDQIDQIEKERAEKDEALQRIKAWRESKNSRQQADNTVADSKRFENEQLRSGNSTAESKLGGNLIDPTLGGLKGEQEELTKKEIELVHPWPEWIEFMERLVQQNYFDHKRKDEDKMIEGLGFDMSEVAEEGFDFTRDWKTVQTAILNFGRDRFDILRSLSRHDIQVLVGYGCPSMDKKVVFSAKLLRKHVHLDEGDVCSSCSLRSSCEKAYLLTNKEDEARTIDVVRVLLTYGFDPISESVVNKSLLKQKSVKTVVRKLLHEVVKLSSVPIDPNLPPPLIKKRPPKVKQPPPPPKKRVGRDDIEMKKGDWLCPKCDFMNFAKNLDCLQCDAKRPKRQLLPGEWECPQCNFLNYRRNMTCFHCEHKRPPDEYMENQAQERHRRPNARLDRVAGRQEVSNAWNFDFDDDESDGADVAAFEFADSHGSGEGSPSINQTENASLSGHEGDVCRTGTLSRAPENEYASFVKRKQQRVGFDDFSDEDDDGIDSYEIDNQPKNKRQEASSVRFSDVEGSSDSEGDDYFPRYHGRSSCSYEKPHIRPRGKGALSSSYGEDLDIDSTHDLPVHPKWKSSHVADSRPSKQMSFSSDEDLGLTSDSDDDHDGNFTGRKDKTGSREFGGRGSSRGGVLHEGHRRRHGSESSDLDLMSRGNRRVGNRISDRRSGFRGNNDMNFASSAGRRGNFGDDFGSPSQGSYGNGRGSLKGEYGGEKGNGRGRDLRDFNGPRRHSSGDRHLGRLNNFLDMGRDRGGERPRRRVNVR